ncbi:Hypothetical protein A7982_00530 [Minicystis rosea]|nr:Hypothetical protein A7982_00530 [Minicystis rosea]
MMRLASWITGFAAITALLSGCASDESGSGGGGGTSATTTGSGGAGGAIGSTFACGDQTCDGTTEVCVHHFVEASSQSWDACAPIPSACSDMHTCACVDAAGVGDDLDCSCTEDAPGNFSVCVREP